MKLRIQLFLFGVIFMPQCLLSQINLDSLKTELDKTYIKERNTNNWNAYTINYLTEDSLLRYIISFDRNDKIEKDIFSIALSEFKYDDKQREVERRYYNIDGNLHFSDWPPIIKLYYDDKDRVIREDYFDTEHKPVKSMARFEFKYNSNDDLIEQRNYDGNYELTKNRGVTRYVFENENKVVTESCYDRNDKLVLNDGVAYIRDEYYSAKREKLLERRFFDEHKKLVNIQDMYSDIKYALVKYTYPPNMRGANVEKYDKDMELVNESKVYIHPK